jgi:hypothetical protein
MKKFFYLVSIALGILVASCDYVENPRPAVNINLGDTSSCPAATFPTVTAHVKKILIEDYTGHICGNCPRAAKELHKLDSIYLGRIIGLGLHVGVGFANPSSGFNSSPSYAYNADFRTDVGTQYDAVFGASAFGLPQGMFNRKDFDATNQTHLKFYLNWESYITSIINEPAVADLQIINNYNASNRKVCCSVRSSFLTTLTGTYKLVLLLVQDSIKSNALEPNVGWQYNITVNDSLYTHRHVLRDAITPSGAWGEPIGTGSITAGTINNQRFAYTMPANYKGVVCDPKHCSVVAFIYNTVTYEIMQSEEVKVIP